METVWRGTLKGLLLTRDPSSSSRRLTSAAHHSHTLCVSINATSR
jgi:hypothetical protein